VVNPHKNPHSAPKDHQPALSSPTLNSSDVHSQKCETEPPPPAPPSIQTTIHSTVDRCLSQDRKKKISTPISQSGPLREAHVAMPYPLSATGSGDKPTQSAQHDQNVQDLTNRSGGALSNDKNSSKHRQAVDNSSELSESKQVWMIEPIISKAEDHNGYDIWWERYLLPLSPSEFRDRSRDFRRSFWQKKKSVSEQFAKLSKQERYVLEYFLNKGKLGALPGNTLIKTIKLMKMQPAREPITGMPWRGIHVLVERTDTAMPASVVTHRHELHAHAQPQHQSVNRPYHDPGEENVRFEELVAQDHRLHQEIDLPRILETEPRKRMLPHRLQRSGARGETQSRHDWSSDSLFSGNDVGDRHHSSRGGHPPESSDEDMFDEPQDADAEPDSVTEDSDAPVSCIEAAGEMQNSEMEDKTAEDPTSEELSAEASQRIIDDLLAKYTTIYS